MSVESLDSVPSYSGRISFLVNPEVIEFEDLPGEERGDPKRHARRGRRGDNNNGKNTKRASAETIRKRDLQRSAMANRPDPCIYYTICIIMVVIPAVVLVVMFVFVLDVSPEGSDGGDDEQESTTTNIFTNSTRFLSNW
jgi:hypothetical protein